jgi:ABC-type nitrate/sulfonate/bicarbonate transport system substrate-binding protein
MTANHDRRGFLRRGFGAAVGTAVLAGGGGGLLVACGDDGGGKPAAGGGGRFGVLDLRLSWVKNVEFAGEYIADQKGYYRRVGFSGVNLIAGGPAATPMEADVATGKAFVGIAAPDITGAAILEGAPLKIIGAQFQKNPFAILSMADDPIRGPEDMTGKKIGVQAANESVWAAFLKANDIAPGSIKKVPVEFDPLPLTTGTVDGFFSFITNEPNLLRAKGYEVAAFLLADHNYPLVSETYAVRTSSLAGERDKVKAALEAEVLGWRDSVADPALGARYAATVYGKDLGLDEAEQVLENKDQNTLIRTPDTEKNGLFTITPELIEQNVETLAVGGLKITSDRLFDLSVLAELYEEKPELI